MVKHGAYLPSFTINFTVAMHQLTNITNLNASTTSVPKTAQPTTYYDVIIIGAGASGLFCAMTAGKRGRRVLVLDHANKAGKKILMSGGGRCNFTNYDVEPKHYLSDNPHFCKSALSRYLNWDFIGLVSQYQIAYHEREHGQLFCDDSANDILQMLLTECRAHQVAIQLKTDITQIQALSDDTGFELIVKQQESKPQANKQPDNRAHSEQRLTCQSLVIATGGLSIPTMGATGFGYQVAQQFGHTIVPTSAGLVPFTFTDKIGEAIKSLSGISFDVVAFNDNISFKLPILFTHRGLSGPAMLQLSNYWQLGEPIFINLFPTLDMRTFLLAQKKQYPKQLIRTVLNDNLGDAALPKKVIATLQQLLWQTLADTELANIKDDKLMQLGEQLNAWRLMPSGTEGYRTAEVTRGGVATDKVSSKTMQSQLQPHLYFIGEVLDVTGWLGGYNFQWAWASGFVAGEVV